MHGDDYANYCPMLKLRAEIAEIVEVSDDGEVQCVSEADHE